LLLSALENFIFTICELSLTVEDLLSLDQAGFRKERSTCDQVAAMITHIEAGFQQQLKTGAGDHHSCL